MPNMPSNSTPINGDISSIRKTTPIQKKTLTEQVTEAIFDNILNHLQPGDALPSIEQLSLDFHVSRIVVREALKTLEAHGILDINSGKKAIIKPINGDIFKIYFQRVFLADNRNALDLMEFRRAIETFCVVLAAQRRTEGELEKIQTTYNNLEKAVSDYVQYTTFDLNLHIQIASASHNSVLMHLVTSLRDVINDSIQYSLRDRLNDETLQTSLGYHRLIVEALKNKDPKSAELAMQAHFDNATNYINERSAKKTQTLIS